MKIGLFGFGFMGKTHTYAVQNLPYFYDNLPFSAEIYGVYTRTPTTSQKAAEQYHFALAAQSEEELINHPEIDTIAICTPNTAHYETLKKAIAAGKNVYCEKPLCMTEAQAYEVANFAEQKGIIGQIVFNTRFLAPILRAKELIASGKIGRILTFRSAYLQSSSTEMARNAKWKQTKAYGGGALFDLGSHAIDLIYHLCGEFSSVTCRSQIAYPVRKGMDGNPWKTDADEAFYMIAELKNGAYGTIEASKIAIGTNDNFTVELYGEKGALRFNLMEPNWLSFYDATATGGCFGGDRGFTQIECVGRYPAPGGNFPGVKAPVGWLRGHLESMYQFLNHVHTHTQPSPSFADGAYVQHIMEAAKQSNGGIINV